MWNIEKVVKKGDYLYAVVPNHPHAKKYGYVLMHRVVMENHLGRLLNSTEIVHHLDKNRHNNSIENLEVMSGNTHSSLHGLEMGERCGRFVCPSCKIEFERPLRQTCLIKKSGKATFCSRSCSGKFNRTIQFSGITKAMESAISGNLLSVFIKYKKDNPEET